MKKNRILEQQNTSVGIVVLNWNGKADTLACFESIFNCTYSNYYLYMVDNDSEDGSVQAVQTQFGDKNNLVIIKNTSNLGFSGGNNVGIRKAEEDGMRYILLLNNDTEVDSGFIEPLVDALEKDNAIGVVTSKIYFAEPSRKIWFFGGFMNRNTGIGGPVGGQVIDEGQFNNALECDYATGCLLMVRADLFKKVGYLDDEFFYLCEDVDFCFRVADLNLKIVAIPDSLIWHKVSASLEGGEQSPIRLYFKARNQMMLIAKNNKNFSFFKHGFFLFKYHIQIILRRILKGMPFKGTLYYLRGLIDFLLGRTGSMSGRG